MFSSCIEFINTTNFKVQFLNFPEIQIIRKVKNTNLIQNMESVRPVEVEDTIECGGISVKVDFILCQRISINKIENVIMSFSFGQHS